MFNWNRQEHIYGLIHNQKSVFLFTILFVHYFEAVEQNRYFKRLAWFFALSWMMVIYMHFPYNHFTGNCVP